MPDSSFAPACLWPLAATLGEGPIWDAASQSLWFVDILTGCIHAIGASGARRSIDVGGMPCFVLPADGGGFVVGDRNRLLRFDGNRITGTLAELDLPEEHRLNDATVDRRGRIWFGSMDMATRGPTGQVHVYDRGQVHVAGGESVITNGPAISVDGRWLYHVDTVGGLIWRFDVSGEPLLRDGTIFARIDPADGTPDGAIIDAQDHLWVGLWAGAALRRYAPDGSLVRTMTLPCANVTKAAFGGPDLCTLYVTTAAADLSADDRAAQPLAGGLFAMELDVAGVPPVPVALPREGGSGRV